MRHLRAGKRLGVTTSHRKAVMRNLVTSLLENGEIKTTITRAKEMRKYLDKMIGFGKEGTLHSRRQALAFIKSDEAVEKLFGEYGQLYQDRTGGYTRIYRLGNRLGDNAQMAIIQLVGLDTITKETKDVKDEPIEEIKEELVKEIESKSEEEPVVQLEQETDEDAVDMPESKAGEQQVAGDADKSSEEKMVKAVDDQQLSEVEDSTVSEDDQSVAEINAPSPSTKDTKTEIKDD
jgi:large subunit ribosomal protein L17